MQIIISVATEVTSGQKSKVLSGKSYLNEHVTDVFVTSLSCSMERSAFVLRFHLKVWVDTVHWKVNGESNSIIKNIWTETKAWFVWRTQDEKEKRGVILRTGSMRHSATYPTWARPSWVLPVWLRGKAVWDESAAFSAWSKHTQKTIQGLLKFYQRLSVVEVNWHPADKLTSLCREQRGCSPESLWAVLDGLLMALLFPSRPAGLWSWTNQEQPSCRVHVQSEQTASCQLCRWLQLPWPDEKSCKTKDSILVVWCMNDYFFEIITLCF